MATAKKKAIEGDEAPKYQIVPTYRIAHLSPNGTVLGLVGGKFNTEEDAQTALDELNAKADKE